MLNNIKKYRFCLFFVIFGFLQAISVCGWGKDGSVSLLVEVLPDRKDAIYKRGEKIVFAVRLLAQGLPVSGKKLTYSVKGDGGLLLSGELISATEPEIIETKLDVPGFVLCRVEGITDDYKNVIGLGGAGVAPLEIKPGEPVPSDFDAFWDKAKDELAHVPMRAKLNPVAIMDNNLAGKVECFDIQIDCVGGKPVSGYLARPVGAADRSLPIVVSYHGAGVLSAIQPLEAAAKGRLALDINAHGIENGKSPEFYRALADGAYKDYRLWGCNDPQQFYFRGMFLRVLRSLQYLKSRSDWDGRTLIVTGGSQGGAQAIVAAALDPQVTMCVAYVPALCSHFGILHKQFSGWPRFLKLNQGGLLESPDVARTVAYYDMANFASRITSAECIVSTGFIDTICPSTSVYAAYNCLVTKRKTMLPTPTGDHHGQKATYDAVESAIVAHIAKLAR